MEKKLTKNSRSELHSYSTIDEEEVYKEVNVAMVTCQGGGVVGLGLNLVY